ncbi:chemotaxis protein [Burkholderia cepacia]|nr:chemotaxis protein [Burkholderia cepacia]
MANFSSSLSYKLSVVSAVPLMITVITLTAVGVVNVRSEAEAAFESSSRAKITQADEALDEIFHAFGENLTYVSGTAEAQAADQSLTDYLSRGEMTADGHGAVETSMFKLFRRFGESHDNMRYLSLGTKWGGYVQWPIESFSSGHFDPRGRPWYQLALATPDKVVRPAPYLNASGNGGVALSFARSVKNTQGDIVGVIEGDISLDTFSKTMADIRFGTTGYVIVTDENGNVITDPRDKTHALKAFKNLGDGYQRLADSPDGITAAMIGDVRYSAYAYTSPRNSWRYYALVPKSEMMAASDRLTATLVGIGALAFVIVLTITTKLGRRVTAPLRNLAESMREIASGDGDMTRRLPTTSSDEVGRLALQFNLFVEKLHGVLVKALASSREFEIAASEVSTGNGDLSARTEQQAASVQETAATMEQIASAVRDTALQSNNVNKVVSNAAQVAQSGNEAVSKAATTMNAAVDQSARIVGIVATIEAIAFQTNILALNAAVESARAGESGRGFAVVAAEVRNLAQRSTNAAKEIKVLLESSVQNVRAGANQVNLAGRTITELTESIANVATITSEISASAHEQSRSIEEINVAVSSIDQSTQQNAALVEQIAAASESLKNQGRELHSTIAFFKLH